MIISQLLVIILLFLLGVLFNRLFTKELPLFFIFSMGLLSGYILWVIAGVLILLLRFPLSLVSAFVTYLFLIFSLVVFEIRKKVFDKKFLVCLLVSLLIITGLSIFFILNNYSTAFFDSLLLITQGKNLVIDGLSKFYESSPRGFGIFIPVLQSGSVFCKSAYLQAVQPLMSASFLITFAFIIFHTASKIYNERKIMLTVICLFLLFFITNQFIVFNFPLILTNFPSAIYLFVAISTCYLAKEEKKKSWLIFTTMSLIAFALMRTEGPVFGLVFLAVLISGKTWSYPERIKISMPYLLLIIIWYTRLYFITGVKYDIVNSNIILAIIIVHIIFLGFILLSKYPIINYLQLNLDWITLITLATTVIIYFIFNFNHGIGLIKSILLPMFIWGGWGFFYVFIFLFFILAYFMPVFRHEKTLILVIFTFYVMLFIMEIGNGGYRVSGGPLDKWSGSGNRMSIHIIPIIIYYFILKFGILYNKNISTISKAQD
jgi:hypothetical protein